MFATSVTAPLKTSLEVLKGLYRRSYPDILHH